MERNRVVLRIVPVHHDDAFVQHSENLRALMQDVVTPNNEFLVQFNRYTVEGVQILGPYLSAAFLFERLSG